MEIIQSGCFALASSVSTTATTPHPWVMIGRGIVLGIESQA